jgi:hypothetical protein
MMVAELIPVKTRTGRTFFVEAMDGPEEPVVAARGGLAEPHDQGRADLPRQSEPVSAFDNLTSGLDGLTDGIAEVLDSVRSALLKHTPSSSKVEISIGFKGKVSPIPVIVSGEGNAAIKLTLEWK